MSSRVPKVSSNSTASSTSTTTAALDDHHSASVSSLTRNATTTTHAAAASQSTDSSVVGFGWEIPLIVAAILIICIATGVAVFLVAKRARDRRKNHGEYRPQQEEQKHAAHLPYITPPNIEGLM